MSALAKNIYFWISTLIIVGILLVCGLFLFPPLIGQVQSNQTKNTDLDTEIERQEQFIATLKVLEKEEERLNVLYEKATLSLPAQPQPEIFMLQLDGMLKSLNLGQVSINVPLTPKGGADNQAGSEQTQYTLTGDMSFDQAKALIMKLRTLNRWNKLTNVGLVEKDGKTEATIGGVAYSKSAKPTDFTGAKNFLENAEKLFSSFETYTTVPNVQTEGEYGRTDPFAGN